MTKLRRTAQSLGTLPLIFGLLVTAGPANAGTIVANDASDVCSPTANPCYVSDKIDVDHGSTLDFGTRKVWLLSGGSFDFGYGVSKLICGEFTSSLGSSSNAIVAKDSIGGGTTAGGLVSILVNRTCSLNSSKTCRSHATCAAAGAGTCSGGPTGRVTLAGRIMGNADITGLVVVEAAGDVTIYDTVNMNGTSSDADGGSFEAVSGTGTVTIYGTINATGGSQASGGDVLVEAELDAKLLEKINLTGGAGDGGSLDVVAGRDVTIGDHVDANANSGGGSGGVIDVAAGRDISFLGGSSQASALKLKTDGQSGIGVNGDGGEQVYAADRDIDVPEHVHFDASGSVTDAAGGSVEFDGLGSVTIAGEVTVKAKGSDGDGGSVLVSAGNTATITSTAELIATGGSNGAGGDVDLSGGERLEVGGTIDVSSSTSSLAGSVSLYSDGDTVVSATIDNAGRESYGNTVAFVTIEGCWVELTSGADVESDGLYLVNELTGHETITLKSGSSLKASYSGKNRLVYRTSAKSPTVSGYVYPSPQYVVNSSLTPCPVCGNGDVEQGESCDDGNTYGGDCCSASCAYEAAGSSCSDANVCNGSETCNGSGSCQSGTPLNCNDGNVCTTDYCNSVYGCLHYNNSSPCNDGLFCNGTDTCSGGSCSVHSGDPCLSAGACLDFCDEAANVCRLLPTPTCGP